MNFKTKFSDGFITQELPFKTIRKTFFLNFRTIKFIFNFSYENIYLKFSYNIKLIHETATFCGYSFS